MTGQAIIGSTDITNLIVDGSYKVDKESQYESWVDGNFVTHRSGRRTKLKGEFDVCLCTKTGKTLSEFYSLINTNTDSAGTVIAAFYCTNTGSVEAVNAFIHLDNKEHILTSGGWIDVVSVEVEEA